MSHPRLLPAALLLATALVPASALAQGIGRAGAVNPASQGTPPGGASRTLEVGSNVVFKERINTSAAGTVQLLFVDKTTLNVGPNSSLVIDEFVYDPNTNRGRTALSLVRGAVRFVGGNTSHTDGATIATPVATIGIRGGVANVRYDPATKVLKATNLFGVMTVSTPTGTEVIRRPGFGVTVAGATPGAAPSAPTRVSLADVDGDRAALTSQVGQTGGARTLPTDSGATQRGVATVNVGTGTATAGIQRQAVATAQGANLSTTTNVVAQIAQGSISSPLVQNAGSRATDAAVARTDATDAPVTPIPSPTPNPTPTPDPNPAPTPTPDPTPTPTPRPTPPAARAFMLTTAPDPALNSRVPYVLGAAVASGGVSVTPVFGYRAASTDGMNAGPTRTLQVAFGVNGSGSAQTSNFLVATTRELTSADGSPALAGGFTFTSRRAANITMGRASGSITTIPGTYARDVDTTPLSAGVNQDFYTTSGIQPDTAFARPGGGGAGQQYAFRQEYASTAVPAGLGADRRNDALVGFGAGMVRTLDTATNSNITEFAQPLLGGAVLFTDASTSRVQLNMALSAQATSERPAGALDSANLQFGSLDTSLNPRGTYIDDRTFGARGAVSAVSRDSQTPISTVNDQALTNEYSAMASSGTTNVRAYFPSVSFCNCEYARWGFWSDETQRPGYSDRIHLGTWIVGSLTPEAEMPTVGTATYNGHAVASIRAGGNEYIAASNMTNVVDFGRRSIASTIPNLDGRSYSGTMTIGQNSSSGGNLPVFTGSLLAGGGSATMNTVGFFYGPSGGVAPAEMGGAFTILGNGSYAGAGTFAARR